MDKHTLQILELDKILDLISYYSFSDVTKEHIKNYNFYFNSSILKTKLSEIRELKNIINNDIIFPISNFSNIKLLIRKLNIEGSFLTAEEYYEIYNVLSICKKIKSSIEEYSADYPLIADIVSKIKPLSSIISFIEDTIDEEKNIKSSASEDLAKIRNKKEELKQKYNIKIQELLQKYQHIGILRDAYVTIRNGHYVFPIKLQHRTAVSGVIYDQSDSGNTLFIEPVELINFNNKIVQLEYQEKKEIEKILLEIGNKLREVLTEINSNFKILIYLDSIYAKARFAIDFNAKIPKISNTKKIKIIDAKHPLLLLLKEKPSLYSQIIKQDDIKPIEEVVPLSLEFGDDERKIVLISGPNAGGKTVALKTIGVLLLMTYLSIPITASADSEIPIFSDIFADIGDEQSIEAGLSTFSSHIKNVKKIIDNANEESLVLIDEIGSGTDPDEGSAIAIAILKYFLNKKITSVVTTHYGKLKVFALQHKGIMNASMEFNNKTLKPTFKLNPDVPGKSYAIEIAKNLGIKEEILKEAENNLGIDSIKLNEIILKLETKLKKYETKLMELGIKEEQLKELIGEYETKKDKLNKYYHKAKEEALIEANKIVKDAQSLVEKVITDIKVKEADKNTIKKGKELIKSFHHDIKKEINNIKKDKNPRKLYKNPRPGDIVWIESIQSTGKIINISHHGPKVQVKVGNFKMLTNRDDIFELSEKDKNNKNFHQNINQKYNQHSYIENDLALSTQLDVRGLNVDQAIKKVDEFLSKICVHDIEEVRIIHGLGNGILKSQIREFLATYPAVASFSAAPLEFGGDGVTVIRLK